MAELDVNGTSLTYTDDGEGQPLVFVHGSASDYRTWSAQREAFSGGYRVLTYSRRYHWLNASIPEGADYATDDHVGDLIAFLQALKAAPTHLVGHSDRAFVALLLTIRAPQVVRSLVLAEPPAYTLFTSDPPKRGEMLRLLFRRPRTAIAIAKFGATGVSPAMAAGIAGGNFAKVLAEMARQAEAGALAMAEAGLTAAEGAALIVAGLGGLFTAVALAQKLNLPLLQAYYIPLTPTRAQPAFVLPQLPVWAAPIPNVVSYVARQMRARLRRDGELITEEIHTMRYEEYGINELLLRLERAGFDDVAIHGGYTDRLATDDDETLVFVARK